MGHTTPIAACGPATAHELSSARRVEMPERDRAVTLPERLVFDLGDDVEGL